MQKLNHSKTKAASRKPARNGRAKPSAASVPDWKPHLNSYAEKTLLRFDNLADLHAAIELLWTDAFRTLPHDTPDGRSIVVPAEAVKHLANAGLRFTATRLRSISDLTHEEIERVRR
jgi:hypothetical protein